jgi:hypothetical protein
LRTFTFHISIASNRARTGAAVEAIPGRKRTMNLHSLFVLAQAQPNFDQPGPGDAAGAVAAMLCNCVAILVFAVPVIAGMWKVFEKAGKPGWAAIIPIYNTIVLLEIAGKPIWWVLLLLIPCVGVVILLLALIDLSKNFGQSPAFAIGLFLLPFVFYPILGFGGARYQGVVPTSY